MRNRKQPQERTPWKRRTHTANAIINEIAHTHYYITSSLPNTLYIQNYIFQFGNISLTMLGSTKGHVAVKNKREHYQPNVFNGLESRFYSLSSFALAIEYQPAAFYTFLYLLPNFIKGSSPYDSIILLMNC